LVLKSTGHAPKFRGNKKETKSERGIRKTNSHEREGERPLGGVGALQINDEDKIKLHCSAGGATREGRIHHVVVLKGPHCHSARAALVASAPPTTAASLRVELNGEEETASIAGLCYLVMVPGN
jgi:hypothetical protein